MNDASRQQRLQMIRQIAGGDAGVSLPTPRPTPRPNPRRGMPPMVIPRTDGARHPALANPMFTTLRRS